MPRISIEDNRSVTVYALCSSENMRERYIGQTIEPLVDRLKNHFRNACHPRGKHLHVCRWINRVLDDGYDVIIIALQFDAVWAEDERWWIAQYRAHGYNLTNATDGGEGMLGVVWSDESRQKLSQKLKGKKKSPEHRAALSEANKNRPPVTDETRRRLSAAKKGKRPKNLDELIRQRRGRPCPPEMRTHLSKILKGRLCCSIEQARANLEKARLARGPNSPETRKKISLALTGRKLILSDERRQQLAEQARRLGQDPAVRQKLSRALTGKKLSPETIAKRTAARRTNGGYAVSDETRRKQSDSAKLGWEKRRQTTKG